MNTTGWKRDLPDFRDMSSDSDDVMHALKNCKGLQASGVKKSADLRKYCSPVEDQGDIGSCTAQSGVALMEYFHKRALQKEFNGSRLFLYKVTRNLLGWNGDDGAYLRSTMKAMAMFGVPPESYWPYKDNGNWNEEPPAFCYALAQNYQALRYYRHDLSTDSNKDVLKKVKRFLNAGLPCMFGFSVYSSIYQDYVQQTGQIPFPTSRDRQAGGHAVVAVGYDDECRVGNDKGAILIRNSWGTGWGEAGYGWLPYKYIESGLTADWWSLVNMEHWDDGGIFNH